MEGLLLPLMLAFPLVGAYCAYSSSRYSSTLPGWLASLCLTGSFLAALRAVDPLIYNPNRIYSMDLFTWFSVTGLEIKFNLMWDSLTAFMVLIITGVGSLIHFYSIGYMQGDRSIGRYFAYLNLFVFFMLLLVMGGNLLVLFIGWEGVGLCSYLLIGFWFKNLNNAAAGKKAFILNRIGDAGFLVGIFALLFTFDTVNFIELNNHLDSFLGIHQNTYLLIAAIGLFIGVTGKSAQIPLFTWLPDAMAGPTPVSALIHAATMVTAGVYLLARMQALFDAVPVLQYAILLIAFSTALIAGLIALVQNDIKKILAYSTVSQLGFMFMASSVGAHWIALLHVLTHAFFKAGLFLSAGNVIHACNGEQDIRKMGGLYRKLPFTFVSYLVCTLAIAGIYPLSGCFSKNAIMQALHFTEITDAFYMLVKIVAIITVIYMARSLALVFFGSYRGPNINMLHKNSFMSIWPVLVLASLAACAGIFLAPSIPLFLEDTTTNIPLTVASNEELIKGSWFPLGVLAISVIYFSQINIVAKISKAYSTLLYLPRNKFFVDQIYDVLIVKPLKKFTALLDLLIESATIDMAANSSAALTQVTGHCLSVLHSGKVKLYLLGMALGFIGLVYVCLIG